VFIPSVEWHEATSLEEASVLMSRYAPHARFLAGGTDLLVDLKSGRLITKHVISLNRIAPLRGISVDEIGLRIGALTTPNELAASPDVRAHFAPLLDAACEMAAPQVRNMATVGGNIASAIPSADLPPILMAMRASVVLWSPRGERVLPLESFFVGPRRSARRAEETLTSVLVPHASAGEGAAYLRFALRAANACAVAGVAAGLRLEPDGTIGDARIALGAVAPTPRLVEAARTVLVGRRPDRAVFEEAARAAMAAADPISDIRGSAEFRREIVGVLTRRVLHKAWERAEDRLT